jgi:hypothetical protein
MHETYKKIPIDDSSIVGDLELIKSLGGWFISNGGIYDAPNDQVPVTISFNHGRAASIAKGSKYFSLKGTGWTYGLKPFHVSEKDSELCFGLYSVKAAIREMKISKELDSLGIHATKVRGYAPIRIDPEPRYSNGTLVDPCILYTESFTPHRIGDLTFFDPEQRHKLIGQAAVFLGAEPENYHLAMAQRLAKSVAQMHSAGYCNDTLDIGNVTIFGEITDFEWITSPITPLHWGDDAGSLRLRQRKEIIYLFEVCATTALLTRGSFDSKILWDAIQANYLSFLPNNTDFFVLEPSL